METNQNLEKISDYVTVNVKHNFTREELEEQSNLLAQAVKNKTQEEANKKVAMADFANKIKNLEAQINLHSGHINNGYTYQDRVCELYLDFDKKIRLYDDKITGDHLKTEPFHQSDFEKRQLKMNLDEQINENNEAGEFAEGDALDAVIDKKKGKGMSKKEAALAKALVPDDNGLFKDRHGNLTDLPQDDLFEAEEDEQLPE